MLEEKKNKVLQVQKELDEQKAKLDRAQKQNSKIAREVRSAAGSKGETPQEVSLHIIQYFLDSLLYIATVSFSFLQVNVT